MALTIELSDITKNAYTALLNKAVRSGAFTWDFKVDVDNRKHAVDIYIGSDNEPPAHDIRRYYELATEQGNELGAGRIRIACPFYDGSFRDLDCVANLRGYRTTLLTATIDPQELFRWITGVSPLKNKV